MKTLARNHMTCSLCGLPHATIELLSVRGPCGVYITRITPAEPSANRKVQQHMQETDPSSRQRGRPTRKKTVNVKKVINI
jgi:hypothetical protein